MQTIRVKLINGLHIKIKAIMHFAFVIEVTLFAMFTINANSTSSKKTLEIHF